MKYETVINEVSPQAVEFLSEKMIVLFGADAPPELKPFCFIIDKNNIKETIVEGDTLLINEEAFDIIGVGNAVHKNLNDLAHITLNFKGEVDGDLAGTLYLEAKDIPELTKGTTLKII